MVKEVIVKAVCHIHSNWSYDGNWKLSRIAAFFGRLGYRAILTSEHDRTFDKQRWSDYQQACRAARTPSTIIVPGMEYSDATNTIHTLVWGVEDFLGANRPAVQTLQEARKIGGVCVLAHPSRRDAWRLIDPAWLPLYSGIELWNRKFDGIVPSLHAASLLESAKGAMAFTGLDFHECNQVFPLSMHISITGSNTPESLLDALRHGNARASAFGMDATVFPSGISYRALRLADRFRRILSRIIKGK